MSEKTTEKTLLHLKIIGSIRENECVWTSSDQISVSPPRALQCFFRRWYQETRYSNMEYLEKTIDNAFGILQSSLMREKAQPVTDFRIGRAYDTVVTVERLKNLQMLRKLQLYLTDAKRGIKCFVNTYTADREIAARGILLIDKISDGLVQTVHALHLLGHDCRSMDTLLSRAHHAALRHPPDQGSLPRPEWKAYNNDCNKTEEYFLTRATRPQLAGPIKEGNKSKTTGSTPSNPCTRDTTVQVETDMPPPSPKFSGVKVSAPVVITAPRRRQEISMSTSPPSPSDGDGSLFPSEPSSEEETIFQHDFERSDRE